MKEMSLHEDLRLNDGAPIYHAFFGQESPLIVDRKQGRLARQKYNQIRVDNPDLLRELSGKTFDEARKILHNAGIEI